VSPTSAAVGAARLSLATRAMGTRFELVLAGEDELVLRAAGEEALREIEGCERALSLFERSSLLSHIHRSGGAWVRVDADTFELFRLCGEVHDASGGAFDPSVGARMRELGFHRVEHDTLVRSSAFRRSDALLGNAERKEQRTEDRLKAELQTQNQAREVELDVEQSAVRLRDASVRLDFGGVAKGHALDLAGRALHEAGITTAFLQGGTSSILALGAPPDREGWLVALGATDDAPRALLRDCALSFSAQHGRVLENGATHVLDPRTGEPARGPTHAAVIAPSAAFADAWSTALLVAGRVPERECVETLVAHGPPDAPGWRASQPLHRFLLRSPALRA
jgi:thiamine biosynthesis lipoprotein